MVLGAINTRNNWTLQPLQPSDGAKIMQKCREMMPNLRHAQILQESIGLRPVRRDGVRIGYEEMATPKLKVRRIRELWEQHSKYLNCLGNSQLRPRWIGGNTFLGLRSGSSGCFRKKCPQGQRGRMVLKIVNSAKLEHVTNTLNGNEKI